MSEPLPATAKSRQIWLGVIAGEMLLAIACFLIFGVNAPGRQTVSAALVLGALVIFFQGLGISRVVFRGEMTNTEQRGIAALALADLLYGLCAYCMLSDAIKAEITLGVAVFFPSMIYGIFPFRPYNPEKVDNPTTRAR